MLVFFFRPFHSYLSNDCLNRKCLRSVLISGVTLLQQSMWLCIRLERLFDAHSHVSSRLRRCVSSHVLRSQIYHRWIVTVSYWKTNQTCNVSFLTMLNCSGYLLCIDYFYCSCYGNVTDYLSVKRSGRKWVSEKHQILFLATIYYRGS